MFLPRHLLSALTRSLASVLAVQVMTEAEDGMGLMFNHDDTPANERSGRTRRDFLRNAALAGAGAAVVGVGGSALGESTASATDLPTSNKIGSWNPNTTALQFTVAVMPDTQFLYWGSQDSIDRTPQEESFRYIIDNSRDANTTSCSWPTWAT
jgi:hypothetical protein